MKREDYSPTRMLSRALLSNVANSLNTYFSEEENVKPLDTITGMSRRILKADLAGIFFVVPGGITLKSLNKKDENFGESVLDELKQLCKLPFAKKQAVYIPDISQLKLPDQSVQLSDPTIKSFGGVPLITPDKSVIGFLAVASYSKRIWQEEEKLNLSDLTGLVMSRIRLALDIIQREKLEKFAKQITHLTRVGGWMYDVKRRKLTLSDRAIDVHGLNQNKHYSLEEIFQRYPTKYKYKLLRACLGLFHNDQPFETLMHIIMPDQSRAWLSVLGNREVENGELIKISGAVQEITDSKRAENRIRDYATGLQVLNEIFSRTDMDFEQQIDQALHQVASHLRLPLGIISHVDDSDYEIKFIVKKNKNIPIQQNDIYKLEDTFCDLTLKENRLLAISDVENSPYANHPCLNRTKPKTYIGIPIFVGGDIYGTLNFSSLKKRSRPFNEQEKEFIKLFSRWIGSLIERQNQEQALAETLKEISDYKLALDESAIVEMTDRNGHFIYVNDKFCEISGYSKEEILGKNYDHLNSGYYPDSYFDKLWNIVSSGKIWKGELRNKKKNGEYYWVDTTIVPFSDPGGRPYQYIAISRDITAKKRAENALKESEKRFRNIFENSGVGMSLVDKNRIIIRANPAYEKMFGYGPMELKGKKIDDLTHENDYHVDKELFQQLFNGEREKYNVEKRYIRKDGKTIWGRLTVSVIRDDDNKFLYTIGMVEDITSQKKAEIALQKSEKQYRDLFENAIEGIYQSTIEGILLTANPAMATILGYDSPEQLINSINSLAEQLYVNKDDRLKLLDKLERKKEIKNFQTQLYRKDGSVTWISVSTRLLENEDGKTFMEGTIQDITRQKLAEKRLREAKEMAEEANRAKSEFLANVSHEIRTPMNAVLGFTEILSDTETDEQKKQYLEAINSSGKNLLNLINDILDLSKIEAGHLKLEYHIVNLYRLTDEIKNIFSLQMEEKGLQFKVDIKQDVPSGILLDEIRLRQILLNLVGNAIKFTDEGSISIRINKLDNGSLNSDKTSIRIEVSDTGIGIPEDQQDLIFQSFQQQSGQSNRKYGGTGLGLTISKRLVEKMGGDLTLESKVGVGSTFIIDLKQIDIAAFDEPMQEYSNSYDDSIIFSEALVLVVDDVKLNNALMREYLKSTGLKTIEAENGQEAIDLTRKHRPDIILMDLKMPVMDGVKATGILKSVSSTSNIPVIAVTASILEMDKEKYKHELFDGFLEKPINKNEIVTELARFLEYHTQYNENKFKQLVRDADNEKKSYLIPVELSNNKDNILREIRGSVWDKWELLNQSLIIGKVHDFANELTDLDEKYGMTLFSEYIDNLKTAAQSFDVTKLSKLIKEFPDMVSSIENET